MRERGDHALVGRAAAYIWAGKRNPEHLGSAIATLGIVRSDLLTEMAGKEQCQEWHVRPNAPFAVIDGKFTGGAVGR